MTALGDQLPMLRYIRTRVKPVILEIDFLQQNGLVLDYYSAPVGVCKGFPNAAIPTDHVTLAQVIPVFKEAHLDEAHLCMTQFHGELETDVVDECAIFDYKGPVEFDTPDCSNPQTEGIVE